MATLKPQSNGPLYGDWYTGRWWVGCYIWYSEEGTGWSRSSPRPLLAVPNVTVWVIIVSTIAVRGIIRQWALNEHTKYWSNIDGCRQTEELVTRVTPGLKQFALRQCRRDLRILVYLLTGHNIFKRHLTIMRMVNDPLCPLCKEEEETSLFFLVNAVPQPIYV